MQRQDWSGHVTMNTQQCNFVHECNRKINKVERLREYGQLKQKPSRNPLRAEKTPRIDYNGFDYTPPPGLPVQEKWNYPDSDWGLMAKFQSQKHIYDDIIATEANYAKRLAECMAIKAKNEEMLHRELDKQHHARELAEEKATQEMMASLGKVIPPTTRHRGSEVGHSNINSGRSSIHTGRSDDDHNLVVDSKTGRTTGRSTGRAGRTSPKKLQSLLSSNPDDLQSHKVSTLKELSSSHPEVIAQWRAQRAADFIAANSTTMDPNTLPPARALTGRAFKPAGLYDPIKNMQLVEKNEAKRREHVLNMKRSQQMAASAAQLDVAALSMELAKTEEQIAAQKLKIGLNTKTLGYQTGKNSKMMKNSARK